MTKVGLINYETAGNIYSVQKGLEVAGADIKLINTIEDLSGVEKLVLPGVGSFKEAMLELDKQGFIEALTVWDKPILGICVGMQILCRLGFEHGLTKGLSRIDGEVKPIICSGKVPHVGFNTIKLQKESKLLQNVANDSFYFMHSFEMVNYTDILALTEYNGHSFVSAIEHDNVYGVQFHPEKSREAGIQVFRNFLEI